MASTFLDQNALIALGRKARQPEFRKKLDYALDSKTLNVVTSSWHLIETANTTDLIKALELADFIDSLKPSWLLERRDVQMLDTEEDLLRYLKLEVPVRPRVTTRSAVFAALNRQTDSAKFDIPSRDFVRQWIEHPEQLKVLDKVYANSAVVLARLRKLKKEGKLTEEIRHRVDLLLIRGLLPKATPAGLTIGHETTMGYLQQARVENIPSLAIESAISEHEWACSGGEDRNTLIDKFHLISAMCHVDEIVSDDALFRRLHPVAQKTGHVKASLSSNAKFLSRF